MCVFDWELDCRGFLEEVRLGSEEESAGCGPS